MKKNTLSIVVSAYNAEMRLAKCLDSAKGIVDEIVVVNNSSIDETRQVALKYTDKVYDRPNNPMLNVNKNYGFSKATSEWIINLDDDEQLTPELANEIESSIKNQESNEANGYWIPRKNIIFGKWIKHTGWYPDHQMRLFRRDKGEFAEEHIHEMITVGGDCKYLTHDMTHDNYSSIAQFIGKLPIYTSNEAEQKIKNGYTLRPADALAFPAKEFIQRYFVQEGYKDGIHGLVLSCLMGFYHLVVFATIWEKDGFREVEGHGLLQTVYAECKSLGAEIQYWALSSLINQSKSNFEKIKLKLERRNAFRKIK